MPLILKHKKKININETTKRRAPNALKTIYSLIPSSGVHSPTTDMNFPFDMNIDKKLSVRQITHVATSNLKNI